MQQLYTDGLSKMTVADINARLSRRPIERYEWPLAAAILLFAIQTTFTQGGPCYLVGLGATAALFALALPRGIWGTVEQRLGLRLLPVGYSVETSDAKVAEP